MPAISVARHAMATRFEIVLRGRNAVALRAAGEAALDEVERLEAQLSLYRPTSEIAHLNARAAREPVRVEPGLFRLLQHAKRLSEETAGAFDITIAPLMRAWGLMGGKGKVPTAAQLKRARAQVGMHLVELKDYTVRFLRPGVMLDLGAIGKGYAIEQAAELLREAGVKSALIHGGTSTVCALGPHPWKIAIARPDAAAALSIPSVSPPAEATSDEPLAVVDLRNESLSVSAIWGKSFKVGRKTYGHILDPRTGVPVRQAALAAVILPSATETDALSTALLTLGISGHQTIQDLRPKMRSLVLEPTRGGYQTSSVGIPVNNP